MLIEKGKLNTFMFEFKIEGESYKILQEKIEKFSENNNINIYEIHIDRKDNETKEKIEKYIKCVDNNDGYTKFLLLLGTGWIYKDNWPYFCEFITKSQTVYNSYDKNEFFIKKHRRYKIGQLVSLDQIFQGESNYDIE